MLCDTALEVVNSSPSTVRVVCVAGSELSYPWASFDRRRTISYKLGTHRCTPVSTTLEYLNAQNDVSCHIYPSQNLSFLFLLYMWVSISHMICSAFQKLLRMSDDGSGGDGGGGFEDVRLVLVGSSRNADDDRLLEQLRKHAAALEVDGHVDFVVNASFDRCR